MANKKALYSACVAVLGFVCFAIGATAVGLPMWGYFYNLAVYIAGIVAAVGVTMVGLFGVLSVVQMAMVASREKVVMPYTYLVMLKMALALLATLLSIAAAGLFAIQIDEKDTQGFIIGRGEAFYLQILAIALNFILFILSVYDILFSRRDGGDPTAPAEGTEPNANTINNPGFRDGARSGISMTDSSGKPYNYNGHGSVASMNTTATTVTSLSVDGSSVARSPLRSSLKKPRPPREEGAPGGLGIHNPGYSGHSPTLSRNGSQKESKNTNTQHRSLIYNNQYERMNSEEVR